MIQVDVSIIITNPVFEVLPLHFSEEWNCCNGLNRVGDCSQLFARRRPRGETQATLIFREHCYVDQDYDGVENISIF
jgi:hypothetical protein